MKYLEDELYLQPCFDYGNHERIHIHANDQTTNISYS